MPLRKMHEQHFMHSDYLGVTVIIIINDVHGVDCA